MGFVLTAFALLITVFLLFGCLIGSGVLIRRRWGKAAASRVGGLVIGAWLLVGLTTGIATCEIRHHDDEPRLDLERDCPDPPYANC